MEKQSLGVRRKVFASRKVSQKSQKEHHQNESFVIHKSSFSFVVSPAREESQTGTINERKLLQKSSIRRAYKAQSMLKEKLKHSSFNLFMPFEVFLVFLRKISPLSFFLWRLLKNQMPQKSQQETFRCMKKSQHHESSDQDIQHHSGRGKNSFPSFSPLSCSVLVLIINGVCYKWLSKLSYLFSCP